MVPAGGGLGSVLGGVAEQLLPARDLPAFAELVGSLLPDGHVHLPAAVAAVGEGSAGVDGGFLLCRRRLRLLREGGPAPVDGPLPVEVGASSPPERQSTPGSPGGGQGPNAL